MQKAISILEQWPTSSVAAHGIRLLTALLQERAKKSDASKEDSRGKDPEFPSNIAPQALAHDASINSPAPTPAPVTAPAQVDIPEPTEASVEDEGWDLDIDMTGFEELMDNLPLQHGFDNSVFLDSLWNGYTV